MEFNYDKLYEATHYICSRANDLGLTVDDIQLNKVLWYSDSLVYMSRGQSLTGTTYKRKPRGPVAAAHNKVVGELLDNECIKEGYANREGKFVKVLDSISSPSKKSFTKYEKELMDEVLRYVASVVDTNQISEQSHGDIWKLARDGEEIPMYTVFAESISDPTPAEIEDARKGIH